MISEIKAGERFYQPVVLRLQKVGTSSNGGAFAKGTVEDNSGKVQFIAFEKDIVNRLRNLEGPKAYVIAGPVDIVKYSSNLALQVIIQKLDPIMPEDDISNLVPVGDFDITQYQAKLAGLIEGIRTPSLRMLLQKIFSGKFYEDFCKNRPEPSCIMPIWEACCSILWMSPRWRLLWRVKSAGLIKILWWRERCCTI